MSIEKRIELVNMLYSKTFDGKLDWEQSPNENSFVVSFADSSIEISMEKSPTGLKNFIIRIFNTDANVVDKIVPSEIIKNVEDAAVKFSTIYSMARSKALKVDETIDSVITNLKSI